MLDRGHAPGQQLERPVAERRGEASVGAWEGALRRRRASDGAGGGAREPPRGPEASKAQRRQSWIRRDDRERCREIGGSIGPPYARPCEPEYRRHSVKRVEIPSPGAGYGNWGCPLCWTVSSRRQAAGAAAGVDTTFSNGSEGFRPGRSAHQAIARAQRYLGEGDSWVVDLDVEKFFDRVNHDKLMNWSKRGGGPRSVAAHRPLPAGRGADGRGPGGDREGTPQGGLLSPLLANLLLDGLERGWERRGHRLVRYADDGNIDVKSARAGQRCWPV